MLQVGEPQVYLTGPALAGLGLQVGRQQHADPGPPGAEQGDGQLRGVFQVQGHALHAPGLEPGGQAQRLVVQGAVVEYRVEGHRPPRVSLEQQVLKLDPIHARPRTRCRNSHSMANSKPISP